MEIPGMRHERRLFFTIVALGSALLLLLRYIVVPALAGNTRPSWDSFADSLLSDLLTGFLATGLIAVALIWLLPEKRVRADISIVPSWERGAVIARARVNTDEYWFSGASGRFTRAVTLPELARAAHGANLRKKVVIQILDPENDDVCQTYANYRNRVRSARRGDEWDVDTVRSELLATVVLAYAWRREEPLLEITVALKSALSLFRFDLGSDLLIMTKEDPSEPALQCDGGTFFYNAFREDLRLSLEQARVLPNAAGMRRNEITSARVSELLQAVGISPAIAEAHAARVVEIAKNPTDPYA
jgi:hypothetical protein